jgi:amino acid transporter
LLLFYGLGTILGAGIYVLVGQVAVHLASPDELVATDAPLAFLFQRATGNTPWLISIIGIFAVINGALIQIIMASRMLYGMSRKKWLPAIFGRVHPQTRTPLIATFTIIALVLTFALFLPLVALASVTSFVLLMVFILINLALINIKRRLPAEPGIMVYPLWVPVMGALSCCALVISQLLALMI